MSQGNPNTPILDTVLGSDRPRLFRRPPLISDETWARSRKVSGTIFAVNILRLLVVGM